MVPSIFFLAILGAFQSANSATCSAYTENSACTTAGCFWQNTETCKAAACSLNPECAPYCDYVAPVPAKCFDGTAATCAAIGTDQSACDADNKCKLTDDTACIISAEAKATCDVPANTQSASVCPEGCDVKQTMSCEPSVYIPTCENYSATTPLTSCTMYGCKWETTGGGRCVSQDGSQDSDCNEYNNSEVSECTYSEICKVNGDSCIYDSNSEFSQMCAAIDITELTTSECESDSRCQISDNQCVEAEGYESEGCEFYSTTPKLVCSLEVSELCVIKDGSCVLGLDEICEERSDNCSEFCKLVDSTCVFDANSCDGLSTEAYTNCDNPDNRRYCKTVTSGEVKQCQTKTAAEYCFTLSTVSPCEEDIDCQIVDGQCVKAEGKNWEGCEKLSVGVTESDCATSYEFGCDVSQTTGTCVPHIAHCNLNAEGTGCAVDNPPQDNCNSKLKFSCVNPDCSTGSDATSCTGITDNNGDSAGCEWSKTCVTRNPLTCVTTESNTCSPVDCTLDPEISEACNPNSTITDATCGVLGNAAACDQSFGCAWSITGTCVEKNCSNSPSYALCCNGDVSCAYCTTSTRPGDCPIPDCSNSPSYALCCSGDASCAYCTTGTKPSDCPGPDCATDPSAAGCESSAFHMIAPAFLVLVVLFIKWFLNE